MKRPGGFTLIELLVMIAIIGLLASVVLVNMRSALNKARFRTATGTMRTMVPALQLCQQSGGYIQGWNSVLLAVNPCDGQASDFPHSSYQFCSGVAPALGTWPVLPTGWEYQGSCNGTTDQGTLLFRAGILNCTIECRETGCSFFGPACPQ